MKPTPCVICGEPSEDIPLDRDTQAHLDELGFGVCCETHREAAERIVARSHLPTPDEIAERAMAIKLKHLASLRGESTQPHQPPSPRKEEPMTSPSDPAPKAPTLIRLLSNAGAEELEAIRQRIRECEAEIESLKVFEKALAKRVGGAASPAGKVRMMDRIIEALNDSETPLTIEDLIDVLEAPRNQVVMCARKSKKLVLRKDGTVALAK